MNQIWRDVKAVLSKQIPKHTFAMWIEPLAAVNSGKEKLRLACPNPFFRRRVLENFGPIIQSALNQSAGRSTQMDLVVAPHSDLPACDPMPVPQQLPLPNMTLQPHYGRLLREDFTFDQFVVGKNNDFLTRRLCPWLQDATPNNMHCFCCLKQEWEKAIFHRQSGTI